MDGATQTLNELLAPVMNLLGIADAWVIVACVAALLFLLFFILFVSRCVKIGRLKALLREKDDEILGLSTAARKHQTHAHDGEATSVIYASAATSSAAASLTGEVNPYAVVSGDDGSDGATNFDDAWRSENTQFLKECETGVLFEGGSQETRHFTDVIFGGGRTGDDGISHIGEDADPGQRRKARQEAQVAQQLAAEVEQVQSAAAQSTRMDQIRSMDLESAREESVLFPEDDAVVETRPSSGHSSGLSSKIPHL